MERELQKYKVVEKAYHKIKSGTGFNNPSEIVDKFVNRERTYNNLLKSIADYEKRNDDLYKECADLQQKAIAFKQEVDGIQITIPESKSKYVLFPVYLFMRINQMINVKNNKKLNAKYEKSKLI